MCEVEVVSADQEQVEGAFEAVLAVVVVDGCLQTVGLVKLDGAVDVVSDGCFDVLLEDEVPGVEDEIVTADLDVSLG